MNTNAFTGMTPLQIFRKVAFELKRYSDDIVQGHIDLVDVLFCTDAYGENADVFRALAAAHLMTIPGGIAATGGSRGVSSKKEGDLSITYSVPGSGDVKAWWGQSRFGDMINMMRRTLGMGFGLGVSTYAGDDAVRCHSAEFTFPNRALPYGFNG